MKKLLLLFVLLINLIETKAQIVFCPPGAEWHYSFHNNLPYSIYNEKIKYIGKAVIGFDTMLYIEHSRFFNQLNFTHSVGSTYLKQKGDTVFVKNNITSYNWQILYNFNVQAGHSWQNNLTNGKTYTVTVDSVNNTVVNNHILKRLFVRYHTTYLSNPYTYTATIVERFGCTTYLFNFLNDTESDGDYIEDFLCYQDNTFGQIQFTYKPCNYANLTGIQDIHKEALNFSIFPNPSSDMLNIRFNNSIDKDCTIQIKDIGGRLLKTFSVTSIEQQISLIDYQDGLYFLSLVKNGNVIESNRLLIQK
jgi:hypothetical protein